ncbi:hypothetical protein MUP77_25640, partial [Candidatus Bathyarchaeota archaeon]|nr:hypothetical protein [Candidatus Bathyarchaeota archaeon]
WIAAQIMGFNPRKIGHLKMAVQEKMGVPKNIVTIGETVQSFQKIFPKANPTFSSLTDKARKTIFKLYIKVSHDVVYPSLEGI